MASDTGTIDLQQVEAERRRLEAADAFDSLTIPDDPSALFDAPLADDAAPEAWARRIVDEIITLHGGGATDAPVVDDVRPLEDAPSEPATLAEDHRAFFAMLTEDPLVLLPGRAVEPDAPVWQPAAAEDDDGLTSLVDRLVDSVRSTATPAATPATDDGTAIGAGAARTAAWVLLALVWAAALASLVPMLFEGIGAALDAEFQIWP